MSGTSACSDRPGRRAPHTPASLSRWHWIYTLGRQPTRSASNSCAPRSILMEASSGRSTAAALAANRIPPPPIDRNPTGWSDANSRLSLLDHAGIMAGHDARHPRGAKSPQRSFSHDPLESYSLFARRRVRRSQSPRGAGPDLPDLLAAGFCLHLPQRAPDLRCARSYPGFFRDGAQRESARTR